MIKKLFAIILVLKLVQSQNYLFQSCLANICKLSSTQPQIVKCVRENQECNGFAQQDLGNCQNLQCSVKCTAYLSYEDQECVINCMEKFEPQVQDECVEALSQAQQDIIDNFQSRQEEVYQYWVILTVCTFAVLIGATVIYFVIQLTIKFNKQRKLKSLEGIVIFSQSQIDQFNQQTQIKQQQNYPPINDVVIIVPVNENPKEGEQISENKEIQNQQEIQTNQIQIKPK